MPEEWLIDGYNLLHSLSSGGEQSRTTRRKGAPRDKENLLSKIAAFSSLTGRKMTVVLDEGAQSADDEIQKYLLQHKSDLTLYVVTDDNAVLDFARGAGAYGVRTREFARLMESAEREKSDLLFREWAKSHGFHRPFEGKL